MYIYEYQAKKLLKQAGINIPQGFLASDSQQITQALSCLETEIYVIKAQILAGGRGKCGGIQIINSKQQAQNVAESMLHSKLVTAQTTDMGELVNKLYIEAFCPHLDEYYLCLSLNNKGLLITATRQGGVNIEQATQDMWEISSNIDYLADYKCRSLAFNLGFRDEVGAHFIDLLKRLYQLMINYDALQIEINPLILQENSFVALDAKIIIDDNALFRQPEIAKINEIDQFLPIKQLNINYIKLQGNIGCLVNGAGLAMATMDLISLHGAAAANFLDVGGSIDCYKIAEALKIILLDPAVTVILINIFGGIVRCDVIAEGIIRIAEVANIPMVITLAGNNAHMAKELLMHSNLPITLASNLQEAILIAIEMSKK